MLLANLSWLLVMMLNLHVLHAIFGPAIVVVAAQERVIRNTWEPPKMTVLVLQLVDLDVTNVVLDMVVMPHQ